MTDPFNAESVKSSGEEAKVPPLKLKAISATDLASAAEDLLTALPGRSWA